MSIGCVILVETSHAGNLGAAFRVAANFGVPRVHLVRPIVDVDDPEIVQWACGAPDHLKTAVFETLDEAAARFHTVIGTASGRGRDDQPAISPDAGSSFLKQRGFDTAALVFGNESRGLRREDIDRCDMVVRIPSERSFPVLNVTQAIAVLLGFFSISAADDVSSAADLASHSEVEGLIEHMKHALLDIGFLDPANPERILRQMRRLLARSGASTAEVTILRGMCRQVQWAARTAPAAEDNPIPGRYEKGRTEEL